ncbi:chemotaxis protein CheW [Tissierella pigra]|uniref:chemotaxis protein CheW n=1 Tax=Tissierella TaxID=41273 RepID=UPI001C1065A2|nr:MULTISPECIES: chemotaxis protein CheW [Tissierella]MBU5426229.1 chemotaxis protein CheW [Tissierella pigra]WFA09193.1 chemotaxis protein CheW [Tissierella sp. Yu-01]
MDRQYVTFNLRNEEYGVEIKNVQEITELKEYIKIPNSPKFIVGMVNIRGTITPIIDLKERFNLINENEKKDKRIIIINLDGKQIGFMIDDASRVITLRDEQIDSPPEVISKRISEYITGVGKFDKKLILILNLERILTMEEKEEVLKMEV